MKKSRILTKAIQSAVARRSRGRAGFTLIEMMVVLAITAVLLGIILIPMVQSFNFTRAAEGLAEEQDRGRNLVDSIQRDISSGTAVADNEGPAGETIISVPVFPYTGAFQEIPLYSSRIDIYKPAQTGQKVGGSFVNVNTNHIDPTLGAANGQPVFPATTGATIIRYWVGLRRPLQADGLTENQYNEPFDGVLMPISGTEDNLYVLYRAEFQPYVNGAYNKTLFKQDPNNPGQPYLTDPYFFIQSPNDPNLAANGGVAGQAARIQALQAIATVVTEEHRFDMIEPIVSGTGASATDKIVSMIQFRPSPVSQEPPAGVASISLGDQTNLQSKSFVGSDGNNYSNANLGLASDVFRTTLGAWNSAVVSINPYPALLQAPPYGPSIAPGSTDYLVADTRSSASLLPGTSQLTEQNLLILNGIANATVPAGEVLFDLNQYANSTPGIFPAPHYPFSEAVSQAENEDTGDVAGGVDWLTFPQNIRDEFIPFDYDSHSGQVETAFGINQVGNPAGNPIATKNSDNVPQISTSGSGAAYTPSTDPALTATTDFYGAGFDSINEFFNASWNYVAFNPDNVVGLTSAMRSQLERFVDLRLEPEDDGWASPMDPSPTTAAPLAFYLNYDLNPASPTLSTKKYPWATNWTGFTHVSIVPGSDQIEGPDQTSTLSPAPLVLYTRVLANPGPNQYCLNYTNQTEPVDYPSSPFGIPNPAGQTYDRTTGQWSGAYNPDDFTTAVIQPRFKVGYVQFDSDPNEPLPVGLVHVSYRFQFNRPGDSLAVNYDSREVINVLLTMRSYPQTTNMPNAQTITLQSSAPVKNFLR